MRPTYYHTADETTAKRMLDDTSKRFSNAGEQKLFNLIDFLLRTAKNQFKPGVLVELQAMHKIGAANYYYYSAFDINRIELMHWLHTPVGLNGVFHK